MRSIFRFIGIHFFRVALATSCGMILTSGAGYADNLDVPQEVAIFTHFATAKHTFSSLLSDFGVGVQTSRGTVRFALVEWVSINEKLNPNVTDWSSVPKGSELTLVVPSTLSSKNRSKVKAKLLVKGSGQGTLVRTAKAVNFDTAIKNIFRNLTGTSADEIQLTAAKSINTHLGGRVDLEKGELIIFPKIAIAIANIVVQAGTESKAPGPGVGSSRPVVEPTAEELALAQREKEEKEIVANAISKSMEEIATLPPEKIREIPPSVLRKKLDDKSIAKMSPDTASKIPPEVVESKADETSFIDSRKPGMDNLFSNMTKRTAAGYAGLRLGLSLAEYSEKLMSQVKVIGLLLEFRSSPVDGLRIYWDYVPKVSARIDGENQHAEWSRAYLAWAFTIKSPWFVDSFHITPKIGRYAMDTKLPIGNDENGNNVVSALKVGGALGFGLEIDMELARYFYILRAWAARDISGKEIGLERDESILSTRFGIDAFLKGGGFTLFGSNVSTAYLLYASLENLELRGKNTENGNFSLRVGIPHAGLGISLGW